MKSLRKGLNIGGFSSDILRIRSDDTLQKGRKLPVGTINFKHKRIKVREVKGEFGLFRLSPITGKTHQLRLHMDSLGMPLVNDRLYPTLLDRCDDNFEQPLQLLAQQLEFTDPVTGIEHNIVTKALDIDALIDRRIDII